LVEKAKYAITRTMKVKARYLKHTAVGPKLLGIFRVAFCVSALVLCLARAIQGVRTGEVEAPLRAASLVVTTASPAWFAVILLAYCLMTVMFAFCSYVFAVRLVDDFRT
jgi:hypothetical protein